LTVLAKVRRIRFSLRSIVTPCLFLIALTMALVAQGDGGNAGGNWRVFESEDTMTAERKVRFELLSDKSLRSNRDEPDTKIELFCENGKFKSSSFSPGVKMGPPNRPGFWGQPQMEVRVRVDNTHYDHGWNWNGDYLAMDKDTTRGLVGAEIFKIQFLGPRGPIIAEFSPSGIDLGKLSHACRGIEPKKR
jgi:hypothetical protein